MKWAKHDRHIATTFTAYQHSTFCPLALAMICDRSFACFLPGMKDSVPLQSQTCTRAMPTVSSTAPLVMASRIRGARVNIVTSSHCCGRVS